MSRPVKWSRDLHSIRERAANARTETWGRVDMEELFGVGRVTAQTLMKAIGEVQPVGGAHFVERSSLLGFLDAMITAPDFDQAFRNRVREADAPPSPKPLRIALPADLLSIMLRLAGTHFPVPGRLEITAESAVASNAGEDELAFSICMWCGYAESEKTVASGASGFLSAF